MAISLVKAGTFSTAAAATISPAFGQATTAGNFLLATVASSNTNAISTTGSGWIKATENTGGNVAIFYKLNCAASETAPTFTSTSAILMAATLSEFKNVALVSAVDKTSINNAGSGVSSPTFNLTPGDDSLCDLVIGVVVVGGTKSSTCTFTHSWTPVGGSTGSLGDNGSTTGTVWYSFAYDIMNTSLLTTDSDTITFTLSKGTVTSSNATFASFFSTKIAKIYNKNQAINRSAVI